MSAAFEAGINFFFVTVDMHWPLYEATRRGLSDLLSRGGGIRDDVVVAGVCYTSQPEFSTVPFQEVVDAVPDLDRFDVAVIGGAYRSDFLVRLPAFAQHRASSYLGIRAIGASYHDRGLARQVAELGALDLGFVRYNPLHPGARHDLFPFIPPTTKQLLYNFKSTMSHVTPARLDALGVPSENWRPRVTDYYRFALSRPQVHGVLCALTEEAQVGELAEALSRGRLSEEEENYMLELAALDAGETELA